MSGVEVSPGVEIGLGFKPYLICAYIARTEIGPAKPVCFPDTV